MSLLQRYQALDFAADRTRASGFFISGTPRHKNMTAPSCRSGRKSVMHDHRCDGWRFAEFSKVRERIGIKGLTAERLGRDRGKSIKVLSDVIGHAGLRWDRGFNPNTHLMTLRNKNATLC